MQQNLTLNYIKKLPGGIVPTSLHSEWFPLLG